MVFRLHQKAIMVQRGHHFAIAALACMSLTILGVLVLVTNFLFGTALTLIASVLYGVAVIGLWVLLPMQTRRAATREEGSGAKLDLTSH
jgi:hypothetical protein